MIPVICEHIPSHLNLLDEQVILDHGGIRHCYLAATHRVSYSDEIAPDEVDDYFFCSGHLAEETLFPVLNGYEPIVTKL